jgi:hypothetical protein
VLELGQFAASFPTIVTVYVPSVVVHAPVPSEPPLLAPLPPQGSRGLLHGSNPLLDIGDDEEQADDVSIALTTPGSATRKARSGKGVCRGRPLAGGVLLAIVEVYSARAPGAPKD